MSPDRRTLLRLAGVGFGVTLAGCLGPVEEGPGNGSTNGPGDEAITSATHPFVTRGNRPEWDAEDAVGQAVLIDSTDRERAALGSYDVPEERAESLREFMADIDYDRERLLFVESGGPDGCHDRLEIADIRLDDGLLRASSSVLDTSEGDVACPAVVSYPSALARIAFEGEPLDSVDVEVTDGWDETATITATVDDPIGPDVSSLEGAIRPETEPDPIEALDCDREDTERHYQGFEELDLAWGDLEGDGDVAFGLRIEGTEHDYGDTARIRLTNVSDETIHTGNSAKYNLQAYTDAGWQDVRVRDGDRYFEYTDEALAHSPGEGFEWSFELTESGLVEGTFHEHAEVCPDLASGRYRFAFWGVDGAVAVGFDLRR